MPTAACQCGALTATVEAYSPLVVACHCLDCQRRTGSAFGVGGYYPLGAVAVDGAASSYSRPTASGAVMTTRFCPACGSTVVWTTTKLPALIGIAVGAFADPAAPAPVRSVWEQGAQPWVAIDAAEHFEKGTL